MTYTACIVRHLLTFAAILSILVTLPSDTNENAAIAQTKAQVDEILQRAEIAQRLYKDGKYQEALDRANEVKNTIRRVAGENHPSHALILNFMGDATAALGRKREAEGLYRSALAITEKGRGPDHLDAAVSLIGIAETYVSLERYDEAETLFKRALVIREKSRGKDHVEVGDTVSSLASLYEDFGRHQDAEQLYERALVIRQKALGAEDLSVARTLGGLAVTKQSLGRFPQAEALYKRALAIREKKLGGENADVASSLHNLADLYRRMGRYEESEKLAKRALEIRERTLGPTHLDVGRTLSSLANVNAETGRYADAERLYKRALIIREGALGPEHSEVSLTVNNLAAVYFELGQYPDAEALFRRTLAIREKALAIDSPALAEVLGNLGVTYRRMGRLTEAEPLQKRALAIREKQLGPNHPDIASSINNLAALYEDLGRNEDAVPLLRRALLIREKALGPDHPEVALSLSNVANIESKLGRRIEAEALYKRALAIRERALGSNHPDVADSLNQLAFLNLSADRIQDALAYSRRAARLVVDRVTSSAGNGLGLDASTFERVLDSNLDVLRHALRARLEGFDPAQEAFEAVQRANQSSSAAALNQMAARFGAGSDELAALVRQQQDSTSEAKNLNKMLLGEVAKASAARSFKAEESLRSRIGNVEEKLRKLNVRLRAEFPRYADLVDPKPLPLTDVQKVLGSAEALLVFYTGNRSTFVFAVKRERSEWQEIKLTRAEIEEKVQTLRASLDPERAQQTRERFDLDVAHSLYDAILGPIEHLIVSKPHLLIVPAGPLTSLPFQVLVTQKQSSTDGTQFENYRASAWLMLRHSVTILPSVGSIRVLREAGVRGRAPLPYIGFGDPVFGTGNRGVARASNTEASPNKVALSYRSAFRGARANIDGLSRALPPLPDTADELREFARTLKLPDSALRLGSNATERAVKSLPLHNYRILHFATHALVAGETALFTEQAEPALALTLPASPTEIDDGLLTSSEVAALSLNADWVILSACNTAAGDKPGAEALTGLARAFFYAGARTLLVSHWPVQSAAAVRLTTRTIQLLEATEGLSPAEALRRSMLDLLRDNKEVNNSHPAIWAPFVIVGTTARSG